MPTAAVAAEQTIALRRHIDRDHAPTPEQPTALATPPEEGNAPSIKLREFRDADGRE